VDIDIDHNIHILYNREYINNGTVHIYKIDVISDTIYIVDSGYIFDTFRLKFAADLRKFHRVGNVYVAWDVNFTIWRVLDIICLKIKESPRPTAPNFPILICCFSCL